MLVGIALTSTAQAQFDLADPLNLRKPGSRKAELAKVEIDFQAAPAGSPGPYQLAIAIAPPRDSYLYSMQRTFGGATKVKFKALTGVKEVGEFVADHPPKTEFSPEFKQSLEKYTGPVVFTQYFEPLPGATEAVLQGVLDYQICDASSCRVFKEEIDITFPVTAPIPANRAVAPTTTAEAFVITAQPGRGRSPKPVKLRIAVEPVTAQPGDEITLSVQLDIEPGWHTYSQTQKEGNNATPTEFRVEQMTGLVAVTEAFAPDHAHHTKTLEGGAVQEIFEEQVTWTRKFRLQPGTTLDKIRLSGAVVYQVCDASRCLPPREFAFAFPVGAEEVATTTTPPTRGDNTPPAPSTTEGSATGTDTDTATNGKTPATTTTAAVQRNADKDIRSEGLLYVLGAAFAAGFLALLTPCVFPMVPITVSFFLKQSEKNPGSTLKLATVYMLSIIGTFTVIGLLFSALFGASSITNFANSVALNIFLSVVLVFFSLNLLGLFEIYVPSWLLNMTAGRESSGGYIGVVFMALTFTLTSFTCTFAFLGLVLVWAAQGSFWWPLLALLAFSTSFALPFFLLALFPSVLHKLPKSGGWLNRVKVVMGLIELAFVFKFMSVADISFNRSAAIFDYHLVMSAWMVLAIVAGFYLMGKLQLPHDTPQERTGPLQLVLAMSFLGLASYLGVGLFGNTAPGGFVWQQIAAFAPPQFNGELKHLYDFDQAVLQAKKENKPIFIDFTGVNCINCRLMEKKMQEPHNRERLEGFVIAQLYTDLIPAQIADADEADRLLKRNKDLQEEWYGDASMPGYAVATPDGQIILSRFAGLEQRSGDFAAFLDEGLQQLKLSSQTAQR